MRHLVNSRALGILAVVAAGVSLLAGDAVAENRGVQFRLGDTITSEIQPGDDSDDFVFDGGAGARVKVSVIPSKSSALMATIELLDPQGVPLDISASLKLKKNKAILKKFALPETGRYLLRVKAWNLSTGPYLIKTKGKPQKSAKFKLLPLKVGETLEFVTCGDSGATLKAIVKAKGKVPFEVLNVLDPLGAEVPGGVGAFAPTKSGWKATMVLQAGFGDYLVRVGNAAAEAAITAVLKVKYPKVQKQVLPVSAIEPRVSGVQPAANGPGTDVTLTGENFEEESRVYFGDVEVEGVTFVSATELTVVAPDGPIDVPLDVSVANPDGQENGIEGGFTINLPPVVSGVSPSQGHHLDMVTVSGENFREGAQVLFGSMSAQYTTFVQRTRLMAQVPAGLGLMDVTVRNPEGQEDTLEDAFTILPPPPVITSLTPDEGPTSGGTVVDVVGENLGLVEKVEVGGVQLATPPEIVNDTLIRFTTEAHAEGAASVTLTDNLGQSVVEQDAFTFVGPPVATSVDPTGGLTDGGTLVTIIGSGFRSDHRVLLDGTEVTPVGFVDATRLTFTTPPHGEGKVDVGVQDIWGRTSTLLGAFEFRAPLYRDVTSSKMPPNASSTLAGGEVSVLGDVDGDGDLDLFVANEMYAYDVYYYGYDYYIYSGYGMLVYPIRLFLNDGNGDFTTEKALPSATFYGDGWQAKAMALGDLDGDKDLDLVVTTFGAFVGPIVYSYTNSRYESMLYSSTRVLLNDGKGGFSQSTDSMPDPSATDGVDILNGDALTLGDLDDDGDLDLVVSHMWNAYVSYTYPYYSYYLRAYVYFRYAYYSYYTPATRVLLNDGKARFTDISDAALPSVSDGDIFAAEAVVIGDVDKDGSQDIVITGERYLYGSYLQSYVKGSKTRLLIADGYGNFTNDTSTLFPGTKSGDEWGAIALALGDLDKDGYQDIVLSTNRYLFSASGYLPSTRVFLGGSGGFTEKTGSLPSVAGDGLGELWQAHGLALGDVDGDGDTDLLLTLDWSLYAYNSSTQSYSTQISSTRLLTNDGKAVFEDVTAKELPDPSKTGDFYVADGILLGDTDGDGDLDVILGSGFYTYYWYGYSNYAMKQLQHK